MGRRSLRVADVVEVLEHWAAGRPLRAIAESLGLDRNTVRRYINPAREAGFGPTTGPPSEGWAQFVERVCPLLGEAKRNGAAQDEVAARHDEIAQRLKVNRPSTVWQRLHDEQVCRPACRQRGVWRVHWRRRRNWEPSFRFPDATKIGAARRIGRHVGEVRLPELGAVRFRWSRPLGGVVHNVTVQRNGRDWYIAFCVEDGQVEVTSNGLPAIGIDRGVIVPVATSDGECFSFVGWGPIEQARLRRLNRRLARQEKGSNRRRRTIRAISCVFERISNRRMDFCRKTAHKLTAEHAIIFIEDLRVDAMTASARGTVEHPGSKVGQKSGLNRSILDKSWGQLRSTFEWHGRKNGCKVEAVPAAYTSQTCSVCEHRAAESRESQARFRCVACGCQDNADVNAAKNILALGLRAPGRGGLGVGPPLKRQPPEQEVAFAATQSGIPGFSHREEVKKPRIEAVRRH